MDNIKIETLAGRIRENERRQNEVIDSFKRDMSDYEHMKRNVELMQEKIINLEDELDQAKT
jgi:predicted  nucleic acid-binding Zn-ribbon protein